LNRREKRKDPLHILSEYENFKRGPQETVQDYYTGFNNVYNAIPQNLRPLANLALIKFPDAFDSDMAYQLRERAPRSLEEMQSIAISVEANLISKRARARAERRIPIKEEPSAFEQKLDAIIKGMDRLGDRVETIERKSSWDGQRNNIGRNSNFRKKQNPNTGKVGPDQNIRPPFQENYSEASTSSEPTKDTQINLMGLNSEQQIFFTQEDQEAYTLNQFQIQSGESFDFKEEYDTAIYEVHKQYNKRRRRIDVPETNKRKDTKQPSEPKIKNPPIQTPPKTDPNPNHPTVKDISDSQKIDRQPSTSYPHKGNMEEPPEIHIETTSAHNKIPIKEIYIENAAEKENLATRNAKVQTVKPFSLEAEIGKLKIAIPLSKLAKLDVYREQISRSLQVSENRDAVNVLDDQPELIFGPEVNGKSVDGGVHPFYVGLNIHDKILHNPMFDSGASHNLMPKSIMQKLELDIIGPYKDLFSFDSSQVRCLGLIKDLCVSLVQYPAKTILMDVVVVDIPPKYDMLLSRSWGAKLQGSLQLDMLYATISVFGQPKRLYRETLMKYVVNTQEKP